MNPTRRIRTIIVSPDRARTLNQRGVQYPRAEFDPCDPQESKVFSFDFSKALNPGVVILETGWALRVAAGSAGTDASPSDHLIGEPAIDGAVTSQRIAGLLPNVRYVVEAAITTSDGNTINDFSHINCTQPA